MPYQQMIFVEGRDDQHAIFHLLNKHNLSGFCFFDESEKRILSDRIAIKRLGGYETLRKTLPAQLRIEEQLQRVGVVVDANTYPSRRWQSLRDVLARVGAQDVPEALVRDGWNGSIQRETGNLAVGVWVWPNNKNRGALEEFAKRLVPEEDQLWTYAEACLDALPERRFKAKDEGKALVHTWLAWQQRPRMAIGEAIAAGIFGHHSEAAQHFVAWVRRLFNLQPAQPAESAQGP